MSSFPKFNQLPPELQLKIWEHCFDTPRMLPRIVKVDYDMSNSSYDYESMPPPLTQTCRNSRPIALKNYSILNPTKVKDLGAIYFNSTIDILAYNPSYQPPHNEEGTQFFNSIPWRDPRLPQHLIHNILLKESYVDMRRRHNFRFPMLELSFFENLKIIHIELPSYDELEDEARRWYKELMRHTPDSDTKLPPYMLAPITYQRLREASDPRGIIPGYMELEFYIKRETPHHVLKSFGWRENGPKVGWMSGHPPDDKRIEQTVEKSTGEVIWRYLPVVKYVRGIPVSETHSLDWEVVTSAGAMVGVVAWNDKNFDSSTIALGEPTSSDESDTEV